jgi:hypothetical protein
MESHAAEHPVGGHEGSAVNLTPVIAFAVILIVVTLFSFVAVWFMLDFLRVNQARTEAPLSQLANPDAVPPAPRLQVSPGQDLKHLRQTEDAVLHTYHWVDKDAGVVGIPIERAIEILANKGLPARNGALQ